MDGFGLLSLLQDDPVAFFMLAAALIGAIALHEYSHALAADLQGDRLPRAMGRLTLNPARHLDPLGTVLIFIVGFGWGRPVEFRPEALASKRFGASIVALAGPAMNLLLAIVAALPLAMLCDATSLGTITCNDSTAVTRVLVEFLQAFFGINLILAVFNLIPLPPLDGSRLLTLFLPPDKQKIVFFLDRYGFILLLALVFFGATTILGPLVGSLGGWILGLVGL